MCLKKLRKEAPTPFECDFSGWTEECLELNRGVIEETIKEAHSRENVIYSRIGSLLALNGVILAVVCTLISRANIASDSVPAYLLTAGICILTISILVSGFLLVPSNRTLVSTDSCASDVNYKKNSRNVIGLQKAITRDRIDVSEDIVRLLGSMSVRFSLAIIFSAAGLGLIGFALIITMLNALFAMAVCMSMAVIIIIFSVFYWKRAKVY